ncbi:formylglycine-generating enzyme family protein [Microcoleus sp. F8-D3]
MTENPNQLRAYDAVKGGQNPPPLGAAVLGGIPGVKSRLASPIVEVKITALSEALKYGDAGLDLIVGALQDESMAVKFAAYSLLRDRDEPNIKQQLQKYLLTFDFDVITVDAEGKENSRHTSSARFFPEDLGNKVALEMVYIPDGTFMMGSPTTRERRGDWENPQHQVTVPAFYAGKYPITYPQWQAVMRNYSSDVKRDKHPVVNISWRDAVKFCRQLSKKTGKQYRLLSEAEWEYACRAGTTTPFHFGETITPNLVNYDGNRSYANAPEGDYRQQATDVGSFPPNDFGLYDMHGNVWEWCSDRWHENYICAPTDGSSWEGKSNYRVVRGGSWGCDEVDCRSASRQWYPAHKGSRWIGFRVAVSFA